MSDALLIGIVGKPSSGKSTFLNAVSDAKAKTGAYPFTTIKPNQGITFWRTECICKKFECTTNCAPRYGKCIDGTRFIPVKILDVAGLIPGASKGAGLGNAFLDDLRKAHVFMHVIDVSGTTNEKGEECAGYDPTNDIKWLHQEIHDWVFNNLWSRWESIIRQHLGKKRTIVETLSAQLSGYGCKRSFIQQLCDNLNLAETSRLISSNSQFMTKLETWDEGLLHQFIDQFLAFRFPTIYVLNKIDLKSSPKNIEKIFNLYDQDRIVLTSALSECFLKKMKKLGYIEYKEGSNDFVTLSDDPVKYQSILKPLPDEKGYQRILEDIRDFVLFRYETTGVYEAIGRAVKLNDPLAVYPFTSHIQTALATAKNNSNFKLFQDCFLVKQGTTIREFVQSVYHTEDEYADEEEQKHRPKFQFAEGIDGRKLSDGEVLTEKNNVLRIVVTK